MKAIFLLSVALFFLSCQNQFVKSYLKESNRVTFHTDEGVLLVYPLTDNTVRVQFTLENSKILPEFVIQNDLEVPPFEVFEKGNIVSISLDRMVVEVNKRTGQISYVDKEGEVFLKEMPGTRLLKPDSIMGESCFFVEQKFESPSDEAIFGLGQFQDGNFNLKGLTRRLTQVNSQIVIPFVYSNKGYGLLWHQYGLTDFNPTDNFVQLEKQDDANLDQGSIAEVTTTAGTQKVAQDQSLYTGSFTVPRSGEYSIFLDLGDMGNRHYVVINGIPVMDQTNMWLPPTAGVLVNLEAGEHDVQLICKSDNEPTLSWKLKEDVTTYRSPHAQMIDYIVFYGPTADEVISSYRNLTGVAPMLPKWAYGFWQCRERYSSSNQLIENVKEFRKRNLPMDVIVQDWQYWGNKGWGVPQFDERYYPNPTGFIGEIHDLNAHFCISIWSNPDINSELGREYQRNNHFIPNTNWLDYFNPKTRKAYWNTLYENMFVHGLDSWWMDAVEPENDALTGEMTHIGPGDFYRLIYPLLVSQSVYEGQREVTSDKRVCILTRSAFAGQQRYGVINWSGDVGGTWDEYRRQIVAGLNFTITGLPYWTTDIGGFFRPGHSQYTDENYRELLTRWFQWGAFKPIFRNHGYMSETEPWKYGETVEENMRKMLNLRYRLLPYIYSEAWQVTSSGSTMMRALVMDFREDETALKQPYQYMFGNGIMVAPIIEPGVDEWDVYLPKSEGWYDFWTGERFNGNQTIKTDAPLDVIPLFVQAGSIIPMGPIMQFSTEKPADELEIRIYEGADGEFVLYEDENNNYNYEDGVFETITFNWDDSSRTLTISNRNGAFPGMLSERKFNIVIVSSNFGFGIEPSGYYNERVVYNGKQVSINM
ncbi:glycoside hydrolase family 31 protein [Alkalitalea saponilacus]|uniref:Alpha-D-xyloside xylohydrolase n=1 Tax=Alkalitalea saponilacus TaxID=889453 RepID=A0A1T5AAB0_9BACT|nr:glycoside hydrolase family 31 protein [Alkalitalea saponilacus]ASB48772.1 glycosyl hydrolase family 31 [Alkalitalea saponilacus]SKB31835.1 alpha-D-xyloside xylohydrolase [Alkalitalea saponilacus]